MRIFIKVIHFQKIQKLIARILHSKIKIGMISMLFKMNKYLIKMMNYKN